MEPMKHLFVSVCPVSFCILYAQSLVNKQHCIYKRLRRLKGGILC